MEPTKKNVDEALDVAMMLDRHASILRTIGLDSLAADLAATTDALRSKIDAALAAMPDGEAERLPDYTANGVEIAVGLRVWNNNLELGTVVALNDDGWHDVAVDGRTGLPDRFNGERLTTRHPFSGEVAR